MRNLKKAFAIPVSLAACVIAVLLTVGGTAHSNTDILGTFNTVYGTVGTALDAGGCSVTGGGSRWDNGGAIALLGLLAMFIALRFRRKNNRR